MREVTLFNLGVSVNIADLSKPEDQYGLRPCAWRELMRGANRRTNRN